MKKHTVLIFLTLILFSCSKNKEQISPDTEILSRPNAPVMVVAMRINPSVYRIIFSRKDKSIEARALLTSGRFELKSLEGLEYYSYDFNEIGRIRNFRALNAIPIQELYPPNPGGDPDYNSNANRPFGEPFLDCIRAQGAKCAADPVCALFCGNMLVSCHMIFVLNCL